MTLPPIPGCHRSLTAPVLPLPAAGVAPAMGGVCHLHRGALGTVQASTTAHKHTIPTTTCPSCHPPQVTLPFFGDLAGLGGAIGVTCLDVFVRRLGQRIDTEAPFCWDVERWKLLSVTFTEPYWHAHDSETHSVGLMAWFIFTDLAAACRGIRPMTFVFPFLLWERSDLGASHLAQ